MLYQLSYLGLPAGRLAEQKRAPYRRVVCGWQAHMAAVCGGTLDDVEFALFRGPLTVFVVARRDAWLIARLIILIVGAATCNRIRPVQPTAQIDVGAAF